VIQHFSITTGS